MNKNNEQENDLPRGTSYETILAHKNSVIPEASFQGVSEWRWFAAQAMPYYTSQSLSVHLPLLSAYNNWYNSCYSI
jgi:hypothetical protein